MDLKTLLAPISTFVKDLDLSRPAEAEAALNERWPPASPAVAAIRAAAEKALEDGTICNKENGGIKFSRVSKPQDDPGGCSIDAVFMKDCAGPVHTHSKGEACLCLHTEGKPAFDGRTETWVVMRTGSRHMPTVKGGAMLILYWWPEGAVEWK
jgi:hypothetical protein